MSNATHVAKIEETVARQRAFFQTGATRPVAVRVAALKRLKKEIQAREQILLDALQADLHKSHFEGYMCELGLNLDELGYLARHVAEWSRPRRRPTPLAQFKSKSYELAEPYGVVLVMSPWNYPYLLSLDPLFGAVAAGNCVVLKPSAYAPNTSRAMAELIAAVFNPDWVTVIEGGREQNAALLEQRFDYIFFTGSVDVGKMVMEKASRHLTPVTLELGGKSPVIVDRTANIPLTAKRLAFGKLLNAGQTCVAPDYCLVDRKVRDELVEETIKKSVEQDTKYARQSGGKGQYGHVKIRVEPNESGKGYEFVNEIVGGAIPKEYIPAVDAGIQGAMEAGILAGYPVVDVKVTLYDGSFHEVDSSEMAFKIAGSMAFKEACRKANACLLEPIMKVSVIVPEDYMGDVIGDLNSRRGQIQGMEARPGAQQIDALVPLSEMFGYATDLRSRTQGRGQYSMEPHSYVEIPKSITDKIVEKRNGAE